MAPCIHAHMAATHTDYRSFIRADFQTRSRTQAGLSLNRYARSLGLVPSRLSEILSGKQGMSRDVATRVAARIELNGAEADYFCDLVEMEHGRSAEQRRLAKARLDESQINKNYFELQNDVFHLISDWHHFALLQLLELDGFRADPSWMSQQLKISKGEARDALARLLRLGLLEKDKTGLKKVKDFVATADGVPSSAIRKFHAQILHKALRALNEQNVERRNFSANYLTIDSAQLPAAKEMMKRFRRRFVKKQSSAARTRNSVYCLGMQFFAITSEFP